MAGNRQTAVVVAVLVVGVAAWFAHKLVTEGHQSATAPDAMLAASASPSVEQPAPKREVPRNLAAPGSPASVASSAVEPPPMPVDPELADPSNSEKNGSFQKLYAAWGDEPSDVEATSDAEGYFRTAFATFQIYPEAVNIRCGDSLCRGRFRFQELRELYNMTKIDNADGVRIATTFPEEQEGSQTVSVYWTRNPHAEGPLTETLGR